LGRAPPSGTPYGIRVLQKHTLGSFDYAASDHSLLAAANNDDWKQSQSGEIQASGLAPTNDREAAIIGNFAPGAYTAILRRTNGSSGIGLVEAYKLN
jgi:hypothetical protein